MSDVRTLRRVLGAGFTLAFIGIFAVIVNRPAPPVEAIPAQSTGVSAPFSTGGRFEAPEGTSHTLLVVDLTATEPPLSGLTCDVSVATTNQVSVHEGNELLVETNGSDLVLIDIEAVDGQPISGSAADVTLGDTLTVTLRLGTGDFGRLQTSSISGEVTISCESPPPSTEPPPESSVPATSSPPSTTPTTNPPSATSSTSPSHSTSTTGSVPPSSVPETTSPPSTPAPPTVPPTETPPTVSTPSSASTQADRCPPGTTSTGIDPATGEPFRSPDGSLSCFANVESG